MLVQLDTFVDIVAATKDDFDDEVAILDVEDLIVTVDVVIVGNHVVVDDNALFRGCWIM